MGEHTEIAQSVVIFTGTFALAFIAYRKLYNISTHDNSHALPPTLPCLPVIGSALSMPGFGDMHVKFLEKSKSLGGVIGFYLGSRFGIILQSRQAIHDALVKHGTDFADRSPSFVKLVCNPHMTGIIDRDNDSAFKRSRHHSLMVLRDFGFGKGVMETRINIEVEELVQCIKELNGKTFFPDPLISRSVMNVIGSIVFGRRFVLTDVERDEFLSNVYKFVKYLMKVFPVNMIPALRFVPGIRSYYLGLCKAHDDMMDYINRNIDNSLKEGANVSFVSSYRDAMQQNFDAEELSYIVRDLVVAGTETSVTSIRWALVTLANHPDIQKQLHQEIDAIVPRTRLPSLDDRPNLPYVEATILELMRRRTVAPISIPRTTGCDTEVCGYFIPKGTMVFTSLYGVHMDPEVWPDPTSFRPERFFDENGKVVGKDRVLPFGLGRRSCLGELLARQEMFLFISGILQQFEIRPADGQQSVECQDMMSITLAPSPFSIRLIARQ